MVDSWQMGVHWVPLNIVIARMFGKFDVLVMMAGLSALSVALVTPWSEHGAHSVMGRSRSSSR